jgi:hypothetical protein
MGALPTRRALTLPARGGPPMTSCNNSWPATPEQQRWDTRENTRQRRRGVAAAANAEDWGISAGIRRIRDGGRDACLGGGMGFGAPDSGRDFSSLGKFLVGL